MKASRKRQADPSNKSAHKPDKKSKKVRPKLQPSKLAEVKVVSDDGKEPSKKTKSPATEGTKIAAEETLLEMIGERSKSSIAPKKNKGKEATASEDVVAVESEDLKIIGLSSFTKVSLC